MKKLIILAGVLLSLNSFAQIVLDTTQLHPKTFQYAEVSLSQTNVFNLNGKYQITIDEGSYFPLMKNKTLTNTLGKPIILTSVVDAINYMDNQGWELVSSTKDRNGDYSLFFRKRITV